MKPFVDEDYFITIGKGENSKINYIQEILNSTALNMIDDEPIIKKIHANRLYIIFISEDNIHVILRGIDENKVKLLDKMFIF